MTAKYEARCEECGGAYTTQGIDRHEQFCDGELDDGHDPSQLPDELLGGPFASTDDTDPASGSSSLPERQRLPDQPAQQSRGGDRDVCPRCGSGDLTDAVKARKAYVARADRPREQVADQIGAADQWCNSCASLIGGRYEPAKPVSEVVQ